MSHPLYTPAEARARETFLALMWAFSYPGRVYRLPQTGSDQAEAQLSAVADTLLDLETSYYSPDAALQTMLAATGARALPPTAAAYQFYLHVDSGALAAMQQASVGSMLYPDEAATLIMGGCTFGSGDTALTLTGPGINGVTRLMLGGLPAAFWELRARAARFPLGWDIYLLAGHDVIGLPRSTKIEIG